VQPNTPRLMDIDSRHSSSGSVEA